jgi:hypothetical protein
MVESVMGSKVTARCASKILRGSIGLKGRLIGASNML